MPIEKSSMELAINKAKALQLENDQLRKELMIMRHKSLNTTQIFNYIIEETMAGYWDWNIKKGEQYLSPTFKKIFGYKDHEMANSPEAWQKIMHPDDLKLTFTKLKEHINSKGIIPFDTEVRYYHKNGSIVWVYCRGKIIEWDKDGSPIRMLGSHIDITALKTNQILLQKQIKESSLINDELEQIAYAVSHDLQEPLRTVLSFANLLEKKYVNKIDDQASLYINFIKAPLSPNNIQVH